MGSEYEEGQGTKSRVGVRAGGGSCSPHTGQCLHACRAGLGVELSAQGGPAECPSPPCAVEGVRREVEGRELRAGGAPEVCGQVWVEGLAAVLAASALG